jgi:hypothetical protein
MREIERIQRLVAEITKIFDFETNIFRLPELFRGMEEVGHKVDRFLKDRVKVVV